MSCPKKDMKEEDVKLSSFAGKEKGLIYEKPFNKGRFSK